MLSTAPSTHSLNKYLSILYMLDSMLSILCDNQEMEAIIIIS